MPHPGTTLTKPVLQAAFVQSTFSLDTARAVQDSGIDVTLVSNPGFAAHLLCLCAT